MLAYHLTTCPPWTPLQVVLQLNHKFLKAKALCTSRAVSLLISTQEVISKFHGREWKINPEVDSATTPIQCMCENYPFVGMAAATCNSHPGRPSPEKSPLTLVSACTVFPWCSASTGPCSSLQASLFVHPLKLFRGLAVCPSLFTCFSPIEFHCGSYPKDSQT